MAEALTPIERLEGDPFEALADPQRRTIVQMLRHGEQPVQALADQLPISRPAVSRHLRLLKRAGLVTDRPEGTRRLYRLDQQGLEAVRAYVDDIWGDAIRRFTLFAENTASQADDQSVENSTDR
ncbi:MAG: winged helix-turn-helix transcriptional regulator [Actinomycetia bacterium]|nr:winged helix-turn-helix transcriptional regulator [Actinomycetes bacterium]